jgi:hypothetical protein
LFEVFVPAPVHMRSLSRLRELCIKVESAIL